MPGPVAVCVAAVIHPAAGRSPDRGADRTPYKRGVEPHSSPGAGNMAAVAAGSGAAAHVADAVGAGTAARQTVDRAVALRGLLAGSLPHLLEW